MSERRDNTTDTAQDEPTNKRERAPGTYYYDDATGYEVYDPAKDDTDDEDTRPTETNLNPRDLTTRLTRSHTNPYQLASVVHVC